MFYQFEFPILEVIVLAKGVGKKIKSKSLRFVDVGFELEIKFLLDSFGSGQ